MAEAAAGGGEAEAAAVAASRGKRKRGKESAVILVGDCICIDVTEGIHTRMMQHRS